MDFLSEERRNYYRAKKSEINNQSDAQKVIQEDALFIKYYGMDAYLKLFPEAAGFGIKWHREVIQELHKLERRQLGNELAGMSLAIASNLSKSSARKFKKVIKDMLK